MKKHGATFFLLVMLAAQATLIFIQGRSFSKSMMLEREIMEQRLVAEGVPIQQVHIYSSLLRGIESNVEWYISGVSRSLIVTTLIALIFLPNVWKKGRDADGEA